MPIIVSVHQIVYKNLNKVKLKIKKFLVTMANVEI